MKGEKMSEGIQVPCPVCDGKGGWWEYPPFRLAEFVKCDTCNGFKILIATEFKAITKAVPLSRGPYDSIDR
jgi:hypothetical protein